MTEERLKELNELDRRRRHARKELEAWTGLNEFNLWTNLQDASVSITTPAFEALRERRLAELQIEIERLESQWAQA